jgi:ubiquinone/menaquinone biosynthesis C-methylase UbiE
MPNFGTEVEAIAAGLDPQPGDVVLDLAWGHANFTVEWAKKVGVNGLVIGSTLTASTFAKAPIDRLAAPKQLSKRLFSLHFVPLDELGLQLEKVGFDEYRCSMGGAAFAYTSAVRR